MNGMPEHPKIYHILHINRLASVVREGRLWSEAEVLRRGLQGETIGMSNIKQRRLTKSQIQTNPRLYVGDCVPFYFCPRSVMLFVIARKDHPDLSYRGGQTPIVHLVFDIHRVIQWASGAGHYWAFTDRNAGSSVFQKYNDIRDLGKLRWDAINASKWAEMVDGKTFKQAEFLVERFVPWELIERIGTIDDRQAEALRRVLAHNPGMGLVEVHREWYYPGE